MNLALLEFLNFVKSLIGTCSLLLPVRRGLTFGKTLAGRLAGWLARLLACWLGFRTGDACLLACFVPKLISSSSLV